MKHLLLILLLQLAQLSMQSDSKLKIRMEIISAVTFNGHADKRGLQEGLLKLTEKFHIAQQYTRMALLDYDDTVMHRTSLTDSRDAVLSTIIGIQNRPWQQSSSFHKALKEMLEISKTKGRTNALKLFLVITHRWPTKGDGTTYDYSEALQVSKDIIATGLFFIVYDYNPPPPEQALVDYYKKLCGEENLSTLVALQGLLDEIENKIIPKVLARACEHRERRCYFTDWSGTACRSDWHYPDGYLANEDCRKARNDTSPSECKVNECYEMCRKYWPWQQDTGPCDCPIGHAHPGDPLLVDLAYCPKYEDCKHCNNSNIDKDESDEDSATEGTTGVWIVVLVAVAAIASIGLIAFAGVKCRKPNGFSETFRSGFTSSTVRGRGRLKNRSPFRKPISRQSPVVRNAKK